MGGRARSKSSESRRVVGTGENHDDMHMIGQQALSPARCPGAGVRPRPANRDTARSRRPRKGRLAANAALGDMVGNAGEHETGEPGHEQPAVDRAMSV